MKPISIAMATYNGARFIGEQLESFARQTVLPAELVVTDDCSTDNTLEILTAFATRAPFPVRVERNAKRLGHRANFMKTIELCRSDLIAFSDQDDVWQPNKLEACIAAFNNMDVLLVYHNATIVTETLTPLGTMTDCKAPQAINPPLSLEPWKNAGWGFTTVIDRSLLALNELWPDSIDFYAPDERDKHDQWFFFLASCLGSVAYLNDPLALYRQHGENAIGYQGSTTMRGKLNILIANDVAGIKSREMSAGRRASILERAREKLSGIYYIRSDLAAKGYHRLEASYRARMEMYATENIFSRLRQLMALIRSGGYRPRNQWGAGKEALARDIVRGIFFPLRTHRDREGRIPECMIL